MFRKINLARGTSVHVPHLVHEYAVIPSEKTSTSTNTQVVTVIHSLVSQLNSHGFAEQHALDSPTIQTMVETPGNLSNMWKICRDVAILRTVAEMIRTALPEDWPDKQTYSVTYRVVDVELSEGVSFADSKSGLPSVVVQVQWCYRTERQSATRVLQAVPAVSTAAARVPPRTDEEKRRRKGLTRQELEEALRQLQDKARRDALEAERRKLEADKARALARAAEIAAEAARVQAERAERERLQAEAERLRLEAEKADEDERLRAEAEALASAVRAAEEKAKAEELAAAAAAALDLAEKSEEETLSKSQEAEVVLRRQKEQLDLETRLAVQREFEERERREAEAESIRLARLNQEVRFLLGEDLDGGIAEDLDLPETEPDSAITINMDTNQLLNFLLSGVEVSPSVSRTPSQSKSAGSTTQLEPQSIFAALDLTSSPVLRSPSLTDMRKLVTSGIGPLSELTAEERNQVLSNYVNISPLKLSPENARQARLQSTESLTQTLRNLEVQEQNTSTGTAGQTDATGRSDISKTLLTYFLNTALSTEQRGSPRAFTDAVVSPVALTKTASSMTVGVYEHFVGRFHTAYPDRVLHEPVVDTVLFMDMLRSVVVDHTAHVFYNHMDMHIKQSDLMSETSENFIPRIRVSSGRMVLYSNAVRPQPQETSWTRNDIKLVTGILKSAAELIERVTKETVRAVRVGALDHLKNSVLRAPLDNLLSYSSVVSTTTARAVDPSALETLEQRYSASVVSRMNEIESMPGNAEMEKKLSPFSGEFGTVVALLAASDKTIMTSIKQVFDAIAMFYKASDNGGVKVGNKLKTPEVRRMIRIILGLLNQEHIVATDVGSEMSGEITAALKKYDIIITETEAVLKWTGTNVREFIMYWTALVCACKAANINLPGWLPFSTVQDVYVKHDDVDLYQFLVRVQTLRRNKRVPNVDDALYSGHVRSMRNMALLGPCVNYLSQIKMNFVVRSLNALEFQARLWMQESVNALRLFSMQINAVHKALRIYAESRGTPALPAARTRLRAACANFMAACDILVAYTTNLRLSFGVYFMLSQYLLMLGALRSNLIMTIPADRQEYFDALNSLPYPQMTEFSHRAYFLYFASKVFGVNYDQEPMEFFHRMFMNPYDERYYALEIIKKARERVSDSISLDQYSPLTLAFLMQATTIDDITLFDYETYARDKYITAVEEEQTTSPLILVLYMSARARELPRLMTSQEPLYAWKILEFEEKSGDQKSYLASLLDKERKQRESLGPIPAGLSSGDEPDSDVSVILV